MSTHGYTLIRHSATLTGHVDFAHAVEEVALRTAAERRLVEKAGGVVVDTYTEAADLAERLNYPPEVGGIIPAFRGSFSTFTIYGLPIAIPERHDLVARGVIPSRAG